MRQKTRQIKFYCSETEFQSLQALKQRRNTSTQQLMAEALESLLFENECVEEIERDVQLEKALNAGIVPARTYTFMLLKGEYQWMQAWLTCLRFLPDGTLLAFRQLMQDMVKFLESSRLKAKWKQKREAPKDGEEEAKW
jgi:hypothetical protein